MPTKKLITEHRIRQQDRIDAANSHSICFVPNPGSQQTLFFDVLGINKGKLIHRNVRGQDTLLPCLDASKWQYQADKKAVLYLGGFGTGKSYAGAAFCYAASVAYSTRGIILANDYEQLRRSTVYKMVEFCEVHNIPFSPRKATIEESAIAIARNCKYMVVNDTYFDIVTAQSFLDQTTKSKVSGMGAEYGVAWFDEGLFSDVSVPSAVITRLRCKNAPNLLLITSTVNWNQPLNWGYEWFAADDRNADQRAKFDMVVGTTDENYHNPDSYFEDLKATRTPELFAVQVLAQFQDITTGKIAYYFNREEHVQSVVYNPSYPICASFDFNVNPAVAVLFQAYDNKIYFLKEVHQLNSDTFRSSHEVLQKVEALGVPNGTSIILYGDATGNNRTANSTSSNWQIVVSTLSQKYLVNKKFGASNPQVIDRCHSFNFAFYKDALIIDPTCKMLIKDITSVAWNEAGNDINKKIDSMISHLFDAASYPVHALMPHGGKGVGTTMSHYNSGAI